MLRTQDVGAGLEMVGQSAQSLQGVGRFAVVAVAGDQTTQLAGAELTADELLGDDPANPGYIVNEPGVGYRLLAP